MPEYRFDHAELQRRREALGLRREHIAIATDRGVETVTSWELGRSVPSTETAALCQALNCEPADLFKSVDDDLERVAEKHAGRERRAQGLPPVIEDPVALDQAASLLRAAK